MATPGTAALREARLRLSADGGRHAYLLADPASGRIMRLAPEVASAFWATRRRLDGARHAASATEAAEAAGIAGYLQAMRRSAIRQKPRFNPLFLQLPLFAVAPFQPALMGIARLLVSRFGLALILLLAALALWVAAATDWAMASRLNDVFSIEAILAFAAIAPALKIVHEFGHVLAATRYGVAVRKAGVFLVGLYPMPFVDCSEADLDAGRKERVVISLAGLAVDLSIGLSAFLLWHVVEESWGRQLLANIFVFNTLHTLLFNLNPLMKLDGYFALSDGLGRRNFHLESTLAARSLRRAVARLDLPAAGRLLACAYGRLAYALASTCYKLYVLAFIGWHLLPQFLGLGTAIVAWGAGVMFFSPMLNARAAMAGMAGGGMAGEAEADPRRRRWWLAGLAGLLLAAAFIPLPHRVTLPLRLDLDGAYTPRAEVAGRITAIRAAGPVNAGELLLHLANAEAEREAVLLAHERELYRTLQESAGGLDPLAADAAGKRLETAERIADRLAGEALGREIRAASAGWFRPDHQLRHGMRLEVGQPLGVLLAEGPTAELVGRFPEIYVEKFEEGMVAAELRHAGGYLDGGDGLRVRLARVTDDDASSGERRFRIEAQAPLPAKTLAGQDLHLKLRFQTEPLWRHAVFLLNRLHLAFNQAQQLARDAALD